MKGEIDKDFYCPTLAGGDCIPDDPNEGRSIKCPRFGDLCDKMHRKHPTPEQYKEEYGEDYPDEGAVYVYTNNFGNGWYVTDYRTAKRLPAKALIVCGCTPFGEPDKDWRP